MSRTGYLLHTQPDLTSSDPSSRYGLSVNPFYSRFPCRHTAPDGTPCPLTTTQPPHEGDTRYCYFHHPITQRLVGRCPQFDQFVREACSLPPAKDQDRSSIFFAFDLFRQILKHGPEIDLVVETHCGTGGLTALLARQDRDYVLIDEEEACLIAAYERLALLDPEKAKRLILFQGTLEEFTATHGSALASRRVHTILNPLRSKEQARSLLQAAKKLGPALHSFSLTDTMLRTRDSRHDLSIAETIDEEIHRKHRSRKFPLGLRGNGLSSVPPFSSTGDEDFPSRLGSAEGYFIRLDRPAAEMKSSPRTSTTTEYLATLRVTAELPSETLPEELVFTPLDASRRPASGAPIQLYAASRTRLTPTGRFWLQSGGQRIAVPDPESVQLTSSNPEVVRIASSGGTLAAGELEALLPGQATVTLSYRHHSAAVTIEVLPQGHLLAKQNPRPYYLVQVESQHSDWPAGSGSLPPAEFFRRMQAIKNPRILEIGSRHVIASVSRDLAGPGATFVGLDILEGENVDVVGDAHRLSVLFPPESFDGAFSIAVFEHIAMPWKVALELNKVLKPGGLAYIGSHHSYPMHELPWDFWRYGQDSFASVFEPGLGYQVEMESLGWSAHFALSEPGGWNVLGDGCYLFAHVLAQKTGPVDSNRYQWDVDLKEILPEKHFYPAGTGYSRNWKQGKAIADLKPVKLASRVLRRLLHGKQPAHGAYGSWERLFQTAQQQLSDHPARSPRLLLISGLPSRVDAANSRDLAWWREQLLPIGSVELLDLAATPWKPMDQEFAETLLSGYDEHSFDAVFSIGSLALLRHPWTAPLSLARLLRPGGLLFAKETQIRPLQHGVPDLWRFSSETLRVLFNPRTGFDVADSVVSDRAYLLPDEASSPMFFRHNINVPCFESAACLARRIPATGSELRWGNIEQKKPLELAS